MRRHNLKKIKVEIGPKILLKRDRDKILNLCLGKIYNKTLNLN